jgi:hypothetical protein
VDSVCPSKVADDDVSVSVVRRSRLLACVQLVLGSQASLRYALILFLQVAARRLTPATRSPTSRRSNTFVSWREPRAQTALSSVRCNFLAYSSVFEREIFCTPSVALQQPPHVPPASPNGQFRSARIEQPLNPPSRFSLYQVSRHMAPTVVSTARAHRDRKNESLPSSVARLIIAGSASRDDLQLLISSAPIQPYRAHVKLSRLYHVRYSSSVVFIAELDVVGSATFACSHAMRTDSRALTRPLPYDMNGWICAPSDGWSPWPRFVGRECR